MLLRTFLFVLILFAAESVPSFGIILDLIGGTTVACMTFIFPGVFYLLFRMSKPEGVIQHGYGHYYRSLEDS